MSFTELGLSQKVLSAVEAAGYTQPTPIQSQAIPVALSGRDVLGIAQTGTGKTGAFVLPMLTRLEAGRARARMPRSLIIEPTRELAAQVHEQFETLGAKHRLTVALLIGGVSFDEQLRKLDRGADVLIATPGRLLDHFQRGKLLLTGVEILVIDEADRMLDMGFIPDIERISKLLPPRRQTLFFSATMPAEIQRLADTFLRSPERIEVSPRASTAGTIDQKLFFAPSDAKGKRAAFRDLVRSLKVKNAIVFCNRKRDVGILHKSLQRHGFDAAALHGDLDQHQRTATLDAFRAGQVTYLIASDVAARGLDIPDVSHVFNFDVPHQPEDYVHRVGRTGRAGKEGCAATVVTREDIRAIEAIQKLVRRDIAWIGDPPSAEEVETARTARRGRGSARGRPRKTSSKPPQAARPRAASKQEISAGGNERPQGPSGNGAPVRTSGHQQQRDGKGAGERRQGRRGAPSKAGAGAERPERRERGMGDHVPAFMTRSVRPSS